MKLSLQVGAEISLENFSLSQLIIAIKDLFVQEGLPGFLRVFLQVIELQLLAGGVACKNCGSVKLYGHSTVERKLKTLIGEVVFVLKRFRCQDCKKTYVPMNVLLDLDAYARKSREFEKLSLETITQQSFRRSAVVLEDTLGFKTSFTTLHSWFMKTPATSINVKKKVKDLIADGTGYKKKYDAEGSNQGEVRVVMGLTSTGEVIPYGAWTRANWRDIGQYIKRANHPSEKLKFKPIATTLITDGEEELIRRLKK
jgi:hypothetical protein